MARKSLNSILAHIRLSSALLLLTQCAAPVHAQANAASAPNATIGAKTRVVILGVDHSAQLVSPANSPGLLTAFIDRVRPDAICIERPPEQTARRDFYEFTYEVQGVVLPYAAAHRTELCPIDWMPSLEDQKLAFGADLDEPPEIRPWQGFQGFLVFPDPKALKTDIFAADDPTVAAPIVAWSHKPAARADQDFPRRLYLYRTFLQSRRIAATAHAHKGRTILVVVGYFHKPDLEAILEQDGAIELVQPSSFGRPAIEAAEEQTSRAHRVAVLSFNLLGRQAETSNVDWVWIERTLRALDASGSSPEGRLLRARLDQLTGKLAPRDAVSRYRILENEIPAHASFTWTGVKDESRLDSYFDPFGNLTVRQRATLELARALASAGLADEAAQTLGRLERELTPRKARQLAAYMTDQRPQ